MNGMAHHLLLIVARVIVLTAPVLIVLRGIRRRNMQYWLGGYLLHFNSRRSASKTRRSIHVLLCIADHFEPGWGKADSAKADTRVAAWTTSYSRLFAGFRDSDGRMPRHTFFYPIDQYQPHHVDALAGLCRQGFGEVEIHLHHDHDTAENLEKTLRRFTQLLSQQHGLLGRTGEGEPTYGFVHGNWALDNSRPDGRWCGIRNELDVLRSTGCYADFTLPSAPDVTQTRKINSIYYTAGDERRCKSHNTGIDVGASVAPPRSLMLIQGPLLMTWSSGRLLPRIENGCIQSNQLPTMTRLDRWIHANVHIASRPDWLFVKLYAHGATEANQKVLLGNPMVEFHQALADRAAKDSQFCFHYVTAREMYNLAKAAEVNWQGSVVGARDFLISPPSFNP